jgi:iron complex transport system substrate-binding protein
MGQYTRHRRTAIFVLLGVFLSLGCKSEKPPARQVTPPAVASVVPAATDLLLGMQAQDHLAAISNFDVDRDGLRGLPRVGDYQTTDWEKLGEIRPNVLIHQAQPDRLPPGLIERAKALDIQLLNIQIERVDDVFAAIKTIGDAIGEPAKASAWSNQLQARLDAIRMSSEGNPRVRTLIVCDPAATAAIGRDTFLNDLLEIAGGENVIMEGSPRYPTIDKEMLLTLKPEVIIQLLPEATPQILDEANTFWKNFPELNEAQPARIYMMTDWYVLLPGSHVPDVAERFSALLQNRGPATENRP